MAVRAPILRRLCKILLVLNLAYCALGLWLGPAIPAWGMFSRVERLDYTLSDGRSRPVELYGYLPRSTYLTDQGMLAATLACLCRQHPELRPLRFDSPSLGLSGDPCPP